MIKCSYVTLLCFSAGLYYDNILIPDGRVPGRMHRGIYILDNHILSIKTRKYPRTGAHYAYTHLPLRTNGIQ